MKILKIFLIIVVSVSMVSCAGQRTTPTPIEKNFPLKQVWNFPVEGVIQTIAVAETWAVIATQNKLIAVDIDSQKIIWTVDFSINADYDFKFQIVNETLLAASKNKVILVTKTGNKTEINLAGQTGISKLVNEDFINNIAGIYPNNIYLVRNSIRLLEMYDVAKNKRVWSLKSGRSADVWLDPSEQIAYVITPDMIRAVNNENGEIVWQQKTGSLYSTFESGILYFCDQGTGNILWFSAFDVKTKKELWKTEVDSVNQAYTCVIQNDLLIAGGSGGLIAVRKVTGKQVWRMNENDIFRSAPIELNHVLYVKGPTFKIYAISPDDGKVIGSLQLEQPDFIFQQVYETIQGVYKIKDGIVFNTKNSLVIYKTK